MPGHIFLTGFPGFIASQLIDRIVAHDDSVTFTFLVQQHLLGAAEKSIERHDAAHAGLADRSTLVVGDITQPYLGMGEETYDEVCDRVTQVWHLAAVYDLAVPEAIAYKVNVIGTGNVLDLCEDAETLTRLDYISTCYVSGQRTGRILETELDEGQRFKNHYESTKCWAEMEVRRRMHRIPTCIHRPAIVVGDSRTGHTDKYDGPYFVINLFMRLPSWLPMVNIGDGDVTVNIVPVNFVVDAMAAIGRNPAAIGKTVQLADPNPHTAREIVERVLEVLGMRRPLADLPAELVERALSMRRLRQLVQVPKEAVVYFTHDVEYDTRNQQALLEGTGVQCPDFLEILPTLIDYVRRNPDKSFLDGRAI
ncbi:MAG TPA: SDR family oxidoreductase [Kofleriaceae bacterium]|nr:SDR family oxidoreductase [Kofleriaceae bacterium]